MSKRTIKISVSAAGKGLQTESMQITMVPMEDAAAVVLYKAYHRLRHGTCHAVEKTKGGGSWLSRRIRNLVGEGEILTLRSIRRKASEAAVCYYTRLGFPGNRALAGLLV